jgi:NAD(P) transhydrogenase subunit alpha
MLARNFTSFLQNVVKDGALRLNRDDVVINDTMVTHEGEVVSPRVRELLGLANSPLEAQEKRS